MRALGKGYSTFESAAALPTFQEWLSSLQKISKVYRKYGSFLPSQLELLKNIHSGITSSQANVLAFGAPPSSGKTHVIALCASYLQDFGFDCCVVTPNTELVNDFKEELNNVDSNSKPQVLSIGSYLRRKSEFNIAFIDEAHNLRSGLELSPLVVRTVRIAKGSPAYHTILEVIHGGQSSLTRELDPETSHDLLVELVSDPRLRHLRSILRALTEWRVFMIETDLGLEIKFLSANPAKRSLIPNGKLLLFSATPLDGQELEFYCNIDKDSVSYYGDLSLSFVPKTNVNYLFSSCDSENEKVRVVSTILKLVRIPVLILINNHAECIKWTKGLQREFGSRVVSVCSHLQYHGRIGQYDRFAKSPRGILVSSSSVYWEGINIRNLRMVIIPNPPYPQPTLLEVASGKHTRFGAIARRRLIQGAGRVGRSQDMSGLCLLLFKPAGLGGQFKPTTVARLKTVASDLNPSRKKRVLFLRWRRCA
ncbi:MAG: helicase-related protein [Thaumarchaeota archaeon]|nr:helicase-related protein [Nitrososphaerota archaeon]